MEGEGVGGEELGGAGGSEGQAAGEQRAGAGTRGWRGDGGAQRSEGRAQRRGPGKVLRGAEWRVARATDAQLGLGRRSPLPSLARALGGGVAVAAPSRSGRGEEGSGGPRAGEGWGQRRG